MNDTECWKIFLFLVSYQIVSIVLLPLLPLICSSSVFEMDLHPDPGLSGYRWHTKSFHSLSSSFSLSHEDSSKHKLIGEELSKYLSVELNKTFFYGKHICYSTNNQHFVYKHFSALLKKQTVSHLMSPGHADEGFTFIFGPGISASASTCRTSLKTTRDKVQTLEDQHWSFHSGLNLLRTFELLCQNRNKNKWK